ncbi:nucleoside recognition domain-containing protein [Priestia abyssalis]|uniref:nucleoside recognition domain-containing protein n=1 Tax=Priestia abyssalis TaxID=1221450 RepID=UPI000994E13B|nr:nucleoside recognition domain-containing protein [Priestia abyssalis]
MLVQANTISRSLLLGFESSGKSTLFSRLSGESVGEETNVKGSTYSIRLNNVDGQILVDAPGLNFSESITNQMTINEVEKSTNIIVVVRGTHLQEELTKLYPLIQHKQRRVLIVATHADKMTKKSKQLLSEAIITYKLPLFIVDTRNLSMDIIQQIMELLRKQKNLSYEKIQYLLEVDLEKVEPKELIFDYPLVGPIVAIISLNSMFLLPVIAAYFISTYIQPLFDRWFIQPLTHLFSETHPFIEDIFVGDFGVLSLGIYSFIWAFPIVFLMGCSTALADETGLKDRIIDVLDPYLRKIRLNGRDLIPIISGFGCNVVAVFQSRSCSLCTRKQCVSFISFGSACSYQIGATLSVFNSANNPWMFFPYILVLFLGGALHSRIWYKNNSASNSVAGLRRSFLQKPTIKGFSFKLKSDLKQFFTQAIPIFILICFIASILHFIGIIEYFSYLFLPLLNLFQMPVEAALGLAFSIIRKDGILVFNEGNGALFTQLSDAQLFILVFLASTMTSCLVTMLTIWKEFGLKSAAKFVYQQFLTSIVCTFSILGGVYMISELL